MLLICIFFLDQYYPSFVSLTSLYDVQLLTLLIFSVYFLFHFAFIQFLFFYFIFFSVVDLQCCVSLMCTAKWFGYIYICIYSCIFIFLYMMCLVAQSCLTLCDPMDCSPCQAPLSMGFSRQKYWSGLPCPPPGDLPKPGIKPRSSMLQADSLPSEPLGKPIFLYIYVMFFKFFSIIGYYNILNIVPWAIH